LADLLIASLAHLPLRSSSHLFIYSLSTGSPAHQYIILSAMSYKEDELKQRTKKFALRIINLCRKVQNGDIARTLTRQLLRSGTSIGANYRAVCRARSKAEFIAKMGVVVEEADETVFWLELLSESNLVKQSRLQALQQEANELLAIFASSQHTARKRRNEPMSK
jgi:four helix bundle protein